ncbi:hypothetical protein F383_33527 [Gossypium arboreum]|uniref:Uncharacterized protein n=1 Tax=Gossypium arboreum TaxID=29729 RepID=A0A0B0N0T5_GOSAR|nr:hypothetical protein F383_33527 [Gossypium arboreum]
MTYRLNMALSVRLGIASAKFGT